MRSPEEAAASVAVWLEYARRDLAVAHDYVDAPLQSHTSCFHAQQAAEKALKALLAWLSEDAIPRTHDLMLLSGLVADRGGPVPADPEGLEVLTRHAVRSRYPGAEMPGVQDADEATRLAESVVTFVREVTGYCAFPPDQTDDGVPEVSA